MKLGLVGLAASHGWSFGRMLLERGMPFSAVWDEEPRRVERYLREMGPAAVLEPQAMAAAGLDGVMILGVNSRHVTEAAPFLRARVPVYINKPTVTAADQLTELVGLVEETGTPIIATSALRYAPAVVAMQEAAAAGRIGRVLGASCTVCHSIAGYLTDWGRWQDHPATGGGAMINLGAHGMDLVTACLGAEIEEVRAVRSVSTFPETASEDGALIALRLSGGLTASVQVVGGDVQQGYYLTLFGTGGVLRLELTERVEGEEGGTPGFAAIHRHFGFEGTLERFLTMCRTRVAPMEPAMWQGVARALLEARAQGEVTV